jgi:hypothetical protein
MRKFRGSQSSESLGVLVECGLEFRNRRLQLLLSRSNNFSAESTDAIIQPAGRHA